MTARAPTGRIVLFGATGHTGQLILAALVAAGERPVLAGRDRGRLTALAARTGLGSDVVVADLTGPSTLRGYLRPTDVVLSAAGPFRRLGPPLVEAVIAAGAAYVDATGEADFVRRVYEEYGPRAAGSGATLIPGCGYSFVAGSLAGALALDEATVDTTGPRPAFRPAALEDPARDLAGVPGDAAARVEVAYYVGGGNLWTTASAGTLDSIAGTFGVPSFTYRKGIVPERRPLVREFTVGDRDRPAVTIGGAEHFTLPQLHPDLQSVDVYVGLLGAGTKPIARIPLIVHRTVSRAVLRVLARQARRRPRHPTLTARVVGIAYDGSGLPLSEVHMSGCDPYDFTAGMLAWCARRARESRALLPAGAIGPVTAFGLNELQSGCAEAGIVRLSG